MSEKPNPLHLAAAAVAGEAQADVYLYSAPINRENAEHIKRLVNTKAKCKKGYLVLTTNGGDPDAAFIIARAFKQRYENFVVAVLGICKSAGTLIVVGADEIVISDCGELGPLDIQMGKDDELFKRGSGLDMTEAIRFLRDLSWEVFQQNFVKLKAGTNITTKTAAEIAQGIVRSIVEPIASQLDPVKLGEAQRSLVIARKYGQLLNPNFEELDTLIAEYPSHGFVIDRLQAEKLFKNVRNVTNNEAELEKQLGSFAHSTSDIVYYFEPLPSDAPADAQPTSNEQPPSAAGSATA